jgi:formylglycine-generating enzyme required for sulfatase activity/DNA-binding winged helix-turn-helix (wHTH) protein
MFRLKSADPVNESLARANAMGESAQRVLRFDRFALDLTRGCLRLGDQEIELRPKAFDVLRHLAANAGVLVLKQDLYDAVWPNISVSDDSLVQCIRELRQKLGDHDHRLIKTVSRRGYLLDATLRMAEGAQPGPRTGFVRWLSNDVGPALRDCQRLAVRIATLSAFTSATRRRAWVLAIPALICAAGGVSLLVRSSRPIETRAAPPANDPASRVGADVRRATFKDCDVCPEMVPLPTGEFMMGAPPDEFGRKQTEGPQRRVTIAKRFALGRFEVTIDQFSAFASETSLAGGNLCQVLVEHDGPRAIWSRPQTSFREPGFAVTGSHPAVCISGHDAQAYVAWLRRRTGRPYRLPTEAEWEYAARAGTTTAYSFSMDETELCVYARFSDLSSPFGWRGGCRGNMPAYGTTPVGTFKPNHWGLADMHGNAWEWVEDCWSPDVRKLPSDGSAYMRPDVCEIGVIRGGSFATGPRSVRTAHRRPSKVAGHFQTIGFRVALTLDAQ